MAFLTPGAKVDKDFTMEVTNKENVTFTLNGLTAVFKNVTPNGAGGVKAKATNRHEGKVLL